MNTAEQTAVTLGFKGEHTGGGCMALVRRWVCGPRIMATCNEGVDHPTESDWLIGVYVSEDEGEHVAMFGSADFPARTFKDALLQAITAAEALLPSTDALTDELDSWIKDTLPSAARDELPNNGHMSADELWHELAALNAKDYKGEMAWLQGFIARWNESQAVEDFQAACAARGES